MSTREELREHISGLTSIEESSDKRKDEFGKRYIKNVRDESIDHWHKLIKGEIKGDARKLGVHKESPKVKEALYKYLDHIVDTVSHHHLNHLDQEDIKEIHHVKKHTDGLAGELYTKDGWINKYGKHF